MAKKIEVKERKSPYWERMCEAAVNGGLDVWFYPKQGEMRIVLDDNSFEALVLKKDGTWEVE